MPTTQLTYPVAEIRVQVGDEVSKGDVICVLDTTDLEKELAQKQESLSDTIATAQKIMIQRLKITILPPTS